MSIGALRTKLQIETPTRQPEPGGGAAVTWHPVADTWARLELRGGGEEIAAEKRRGHLTYLVTLRWRTGLGPTQRFRLGARVLEIERAADPDGRRRWLMCLCKERTEP